MSAIQSAADAPLVGNHNLDELRNRQHSDDESSLHYEKSGMEEPEVRAQDDEEMYDDTKEDLYEEVGSIQPATPSQQSSQPIQYEISAAVATSPKPGLTEQLYLFMHSFIYCSHYIDRYYLETQSLEMKIAFAVF